MDWLFPAVRVFRLGSAGRPYLVCSADGKYILKGVPEDGASQMVREECRGFFGGAEFHPVPVIRISVKNGDWYDWCHVGVKVPKAINTVNPWSLYSWETDKTTVIGSWFSCVSGVKYSRHIEKRTYNTILYGIIV